MRHFHLLADRGVRFVDCPLVGSSREIGEGNAVAIVGDREEIADYASLLNTFAKRVFFLGAAGRGHTAKLVVNLVLGLHRVVLSEGLGLANRCDLDLAQALGDSESQRRLFRSHGEPRAMSCSRATSPGLQPGSRNTPRTSG